MQQLIAQNQLMGLSHPLSNMTGLNQLGGQLNLNMLQGMNNQLGLLGLSGINNINTLASLQSLQQNLISQNSNLSFLDQNSSSANYLNPNKNYSAPSQIKKRESKGANKFQSTETKDPSTSNKIVPLAQVNSLISGQAPGGFVMGANKMRRMTNEGSSLLGDY